MSFANCGSPIPVVRLNQDDKENHHDSDYEQDTMGDNEKTPGKGRSRRFRIGKKVGEWASGRTDTEGAVENRAGLQDHILEKLLAQVIPSDDTPSSPLQHGGVEKPNFSLPTMSTNFRRFNSRIGVIFIFQARLLRLLSWRKYSHTLSLLFVYTFVCLDPSLLPVLALTVLLLGVFIPAFLARHPAPPIALSSSFEYSPRGPPLAPPQQTKPVKELSKDFWRNMRDLQNCMEDFSVAHDVIVSLVGPVTNFSDESLSSTIFVGVFMATAALFIASHLIPWRFLFLIGGWFVITSGHPKMAKMLDQTRKEQLEPREKEAKSFLDSWIESDILLDSLPESREVEIFELQRLSGAGEWEPWLFSASPYDPLSADRIRGERPRGTRFFEDVRPPGYSDPRGWEWEEKKWSLDLWSREWVEERIITGVEIETGGERWVYDIHYEDGEGWSRQGVREDEGKKGKGKQAPIKPTWEEGVEGQGKKGAWRRRRWTRLVRRKVVEGEVPQ